MEIIEAAPVKDAVLVNRYIDWMVRVKRRSTTTIYSYRQDYMKLLDFLQARRVTLATAHTDDLLAWMQRPRRPYKGSTQAAPATLKREIMELRSLYKWLFREGFVPRDPTAVLLDSVPKVANDDPKPVAMEDWRRLWHSDLSDGNRVAFGLAMFLGLRRFEVTGLSPEHVVESPFRVVGVKRKGGSKQGLPIDSALGVWMKHYPDLIGDPERFTAPLRRLVEEQQGRPRLLPWGDERRSWVRERQGDAWIEGEVNPDAFNHHLRFALRRCGLAEDEFTPHMLRHGFGTYLCAAGVPVQVVSRLMGHSNLAITMRYVEVGADPLAAYGVDLPDDGLIAVRRFS